MARKNLLSGLVPQELSADNSPANLTPSPLDHTSASFGQKGAIGAVSRSIERLKSQSVVELEPDLIDAPIVSDRLEEDDEQFAEFARQIAQTGQQVPILVRPHPQREGRYQIAYGRRRLRAVKLAGKLVKATVRPLTDDELIIAQGQENSAREDLSYIEKALYGLELEKHGFSRQIIMAALAVDKAALSHLVNTASRVPQDVIRLIGRAPRAGRDRWVKLAACLADEHSLAKARTLLNGELVALQTDERFARVLSAMTSRKQGAIARTWKTPDGHIGATIKDDERKIALEFDKRVVPDFGQFLLAKLPDIYQEFLAMPQD